MHFACVVGPRGLGHCSEQGEAGPDREVRGSGVVLLFVDLCMLQLGHLGDDAVVHEHGVSWSFSRRVSRIDDVDIGHGRVFSSFSNSRAK